MKKILYKLSGICLFIATLNSCSKNETPLFNTEYSALNIWFESSAIVLDSTTYNYSYSLGIDSLMFHARVTGLPAERDRTFTLETYFGDVSEAEGSFKTKVYSIKAGESSANFPIYFDSSKLKNNQSFTKKDGHIYFRMVENTEFAAGADKMRSLKVILKNYLAKPAEWDNAVNPIQPYSIYFGQYSRIKYSFMVQVTKLVDFHISYTASKSYDEETNTISASYASYLVSRLKQALDEYNNSHETDLIDENNSVVVF